jgi:hypothetical protein
MFVEELVMNVPRTGKFLSYQNILSKLSGEDAHMTIKIMVWKKRT